MKILYVTTQAPWPLRSGSRIRSYHVIDALSRKHEVTVALANTDREETAGFSGCEGGAWNRCIADRRRRRLANRISGIVTGSRIVLRPKDKDAYREAFLRWVDEVEPDLVWFFQSSSFWQTGGSEGLPAVYDMDDLESTKRERLLRHEPPWRRAVAALDHFAFNLAEQSLLRSASTVLVSNPNDEPLVASMTDAAVLPLPNGFDFSRDITARPRRSRRILFYGLMTYRPNEDGVLWFCDEVWPLVRAAAPDAVLDVVGSYHKPVRRIHGIPGITLHGEAADLDPHIDRSAMLVVPLRIGGGTRIKILEAWAKGLPVVSTTIGCEGLGAADGEHLLTGDSAGHFAAQCLRLLQDPDLGVQLAENAFEHGKRHFDWPIIHQAIDRAVDTAIERFSGRKSSTPPASPLPVNNI